MDYDFSDYCDDQLSKTFNPFACELQPLLVSKENGIYFVCNLSIKVVIYIFSSKCIIKDFVMTVFGNDFYICT